MTPSNRTITASWPASKTTSTTNHQHSNTPRWSEIYRSFGPNISIQTTRTLKDQGGHIEHKAFGRSVDGGTTVAAVKLVCMHPIPPKQKPQQPPPHLDNPVPGGCGEAFPLVLIVQQSSQRPALHQVSDDRQLGRGGHGTVHSRHAFFFFFSPR